jgi:phosphatidylserine/phosphatidylglycerophosphate/cardiolipin synthase-like enzyme
MSTQWLRSFTAWIIVAFMGVGMGLPRYAGADEKVGSGASVAESAGSAKPVAVQDGISVFFSPRGGCTEAVIEQIGSAQKSLKVQAYYVTSAPIAKAVSDAKKRGVEVTVLLDKSQQTAKYSSATFFFNSGVPTFIDSRHTIAHNKIILIDDRTILTGSFNFTKAAEESNAENLLIIQNKPELMVAYQRNFEEHLKHATPYQGLGAKTPDGAEPAPEKPEQEKSEGESRPAVGATEVHATKAGAKYHVAGCRFLAKSDIMMTLEQAKAKGLTPCSRCNPPQ